MKKIIWVVSIMLGAAFCIAADSVCALYSDIESYADWGMCLSEGARSLAEDDSGNIYALCSESLHCVTQTGRNLWSADIGGEYIENLGDDYFIVVGDSLTRIRRNSVVWRTPVSGVHVLVTEDNGFLILDESRGAIIRADSAGMPSDTNEYSNFELSDLKIKNTGEIVCVAKNKTSGVLVVFELDEDGDTVTVVTTEQEPDKIGRTVCILKNGNLAVHDSKDFYGYLWIYNHEYQLVSTEGTFFMFVGTSQGDSWTHSISPTYDGGCIVRGSIRYDYGGGGRVRHRQLIKYTVDGEYDWYRCSRQSNAYEVNPVIQSGVDSSYLFTGHDQLFKYTLPDTTTVWNIRISNSLDLSRERTIVYCQAGDTTLDSTEYQKVYWQEGDTVYRPNNSDLYAFIREEGEKVYAAFDETTETVLYDFGKGPGDTIRYDYMIYPFHPPEPMRWDGYNVVKTVDSVQLEDGWHTRQTMADNSVCIKEVGDTRGLFGPILAYPSDGSSYELTWYKKRGRRIYTSDDVSITNRTINGVPVEIQASDFMYYRVDGSFAGSSLHKTMPAGIYIRYDRVTGKAVLIHWVR